MCIVSNGVVCFEFDSAFSVASLCSVEIASCELATAHALDEERSCRDGKEGPVVVRHTCERVGEDFPLLGGGNNVHENGRFDVVRGIVVDEKTVTDSRTSVMSTPNHRSLLAKDLLESFHDQVPDRTFVALWW